MSSKKYSSYQEIENDLLILQLEREIKFKKMELHFDNVKDTFRLGNMVEGYLGFSQKSQSNGIAKLVTWLIPYLLTWFNKKDENTTNA